jgi:hypothetical protein
MARRIPGECIPAKLFVLADADQSLFLPAFPACEPRFQDSVGGEPGVERPDWDRESGGKPEQGIRMERMANKHRQAAEGQANAGIKGYGLDQACQDPDASGVPVLRHVRDGPTKRAGKSARQTRQSRPTKARHRLPMREPSRANRQPSRELLIHDMGRADRAPVGSDDQSHPSAQAGTRKVLRRLVDQILTGVDGRIQGRPVDLDLLGVRRNCDR